ncbi:hypothetical protein HHK36_032085 [Tetracentron sinense]|uniref:tRNA (guanine(37)-N1)-methyltransferase n=1 Tax=Tetracentron sinense TaxID=13715 RepID=A0A834Y9S9_TETSI|nr:hypothetical protein HHK36_032085 [Tetracentron sinense]
MVTKLFIRSHSLPFAISRANTFFRRPSFPKPYFLPLFSTISSTLALTLDRDLPYGPSLHKGRNPYQQEQILHGLSQSPVKILIGEEEEEENVIDKESFSRVFDIASIRVPAEDCFALENQLRGHLLNWPRVRNIARVPGDEMEDEFKSILLEKSNDGDSDEENLNSLNRRIYGKADGDGESLSPVLYRDMLSKTFNSRGFVKFRNLAKISRPKRKKKRNEREGLEGKNRAGKNDFAVVEVVEDRDEEEDMSGLLGDEFKGGRWRGSTRLLLLDERYANTGIEELPEAVQDQSVSRNVAFQRKDLAATFTFLSRHVLALIREFEICQIYAVLNGDIRQSRTSTSELVRCKLTLFYNYWQMNENDDLNFDISAMIVAVGSVVETGEGCVGVGGGGEGQILEALLPKGMIVPSAFETVGHIAHLNLRDEHLSYKKLIAQVVLDKNKPKIQTVVNKIDAIQNDYRTMQLEVLAGNHSLVTTVVENGVRFNVDLAAVYWNSRLATERQRLVNCFTRNDVVCDVFAGVGPIAISAAKKVKRVYANDLNPCAVEYLENNSVLNKVERKIEVFNMDGRRFINAIFASQKAESITHVVMNLPNDAAEYLDAFRGIFRRRSKEKECTLPVIHVYGFSKAQDPEFDFHERIKTALMEVAVEVEMHRVRLVAPGKWMICASFGLPEKVAFAKQF